MADVGTAGAPKSALLSLQPSKVQAMLLGAAIGPDELVAAHFADWKGSVDFEGEIGEQAYRQLPLVYERLRALDNRDDLMGRLKGIYRKSWSENQVRLHAAARALETLEEAGIATLVLGAAPLGFAFFPSIATRTFLKLDVTVRRHQLGETFDRLRALGWSGSAASHFLPAPEIDVVRLWHADAPPIDLHVYCLRETPSAEVDLWFWAACEPFDMWGTRLRHPGATALLVYAITRGFKSRQEPALQWIVDSALLIARGGIDWDRLVAFAQAQRLSYRLCAALRLLRNDYHANIPIGVIEVLARHGISLVERIENRALLRRSDKPFPAPLLIMIDYWRFGRNEPPVRFAIRYGRYLARKSGIPNSRRLWAASGRHLRKLTGRLRATR